MRSKSLISEIECIFDERQEQLAENGTVSGPHLSFSFPVRHYILSTPLCSRLIPPPLSLSPYLGPPSFSPSLSPYPPLQGEQRVFADAVGLVMYYLKRASTMQREDAIKIRSFLTHTLADFCFYERYTTIHVYMYIRCSKPSDPTKIILNETCTKPL